MVENPIEQTVDSMASEKAFFAQIVAESKGEPTPNEPPAGDPPKPLEPPANEPITPVESAKPAEPAAAIEITDEIRLKEINSIWGTEFSSIDEFKAKKAELDELPTLKTRVEELTKTPPKRYASAKAEELDKFFSATGIEDDRIATDLKRFEADTAKTPIEAMVLAEIIKDPELFDKKEMLRKTILANYNTHIDPDLDGDELRAEQERVELVKFKMERDAKSAYETINGISEKVKSYKDADTATSDQQKQRSEQSKAQWTETLNKVGKDIFKSLEISVPWGKDKDGKEVTKIIDTVELTPAQQSEAIADIVNLAAANNFELTNENLQQLVDAKKSILAFQNYGASVHKFVENRLAEERLNWEKGIHNPSSLKIDAPSGGAQESSPEQRLFDKAREVFGH